MIESEMSLFRYEAKKKTTIKNRQPTRAPQLRQEKLCQASDIENEKYLISKNFCFGARVGVLTRLKNCHNHYKSCFLNFRLSFCYSAYCIYFI